MKRVIVLLTFAIFLVGCGYKPTSHYAKQKVKGNVFVDMHISIEDPKNSVIIKDTMTEILINRFGAKLVYDKSIADTLFYLKLNSVSMQVLQYDEDGFEQLYRAHVNIDVNYSSNTDKGSVTVSGIHDFSVDGQDEITEIQRFDAIRNASSKALEEVMSKIAVETFRKKPQTKLNEQSVNDN